MTAVVEQAAPLSDQDRVADAGIDSHASAAPQGDSFVSGVALLLSLSLAQRFIGFVRNVLICRYLDPGELGRWNLAFNAIEIISPLVVLGLPGTMGRYFESFRQQGRPRWFVRQLALATGTLTAVGLLLLTAFRPTVAWMLFSDPRQTGLLSWVLAALAIVITYNFLVQLTTALRRPRVLSILHFVNSAMFAVLAILFLKTTALGAAGLVAAYAGACMAGIVVAVVALRGLFGELRDQPAEVSGAIAPLWRRLLPLAGALWLNDSLCNAFYTADRVMLVHFADTSVGNPIAIVGQYHSSRVLGVLIAALGGMLAQVFLPYLSHDWEENRKLAVSQQINFALKIVSVVLTTVSSGILLVAPVLFGQVMQGKYLEGFQVLPPTLTYCIWFGLLLVVQNYLWLAEQAKWANAGVAVALLLNVGLNFILVPTWGLAGAVTATTIANLVLLVVALCFSNRFGLQLHRGVTVAVLLPVALIGGPLAGFAGVLLAVGAALGSESILSTWERAQLRHRWERFFHGPGSDASFGHKPDDPAQTTSEKWV